MVQPRAVHNSCRMSHAPGSALYNKIQKQYAHSQVHGEGWQGTQGRLEGCSLQVIAPKDGL